jgi:hypothetical protein
MQTRVLRLLSGTALVLLVVDGFILLQSGTLGLFGYAPVGAPLSAWLGVLLSSLVPQTASTLALAAAVAAAVIAAQARRWRWCGALLAGLALASYGAPLVFDVGMASLGAQSYSAVAFLLISRVLLLAPSPLLALLSTRPRLAGLLLAAPEAAPAAADGLDGDELDIEISSLG